MSNLVAAVLLALCRSINRPQWQGPRLSSEADEKWETECSSDSFVDGRTAYWMSRSWGGVINSSSQTSELVYALWWGKTGAEMRIRFWLAAIKMSTIENSFCQRNGKLNAVAPTNMALMVAYATFAMWGRVLFCKQSDITMLIWLMNCLLITQLKKNSK